MGLLLALVLVVASLFRLAEGRSLPDWASLLTVGIVVAGTGIALGVILYLAYRAYSLSIDPAGLCGRTYWGRRAQFGWNDIDKVEECAVDGSPSLLVCSASSKQKIFIPMLGVSAPEIHRQLVRHAGSDHTLTEWFRPTGA